MKISQTWFASHTGPIERSIDRPRRRAALGPARGQVPEPGAEVGSTEHRVRRPGRRSSTTAIAVLTVPAPRRTASGLDLARGPRPGSLLGSGPYGVSWSTKPPARRKRRLIPRSTRIVVIAERDVEHDHGDERDPDAGVGGRRVLHLHLVVDDPRLPADLGDDPARLHRDHRQHAGARRGPQEPPARGHPPAEEPARAVPDRQQEQQRCRARP